MLKSVATLIGILAMTGLLAPVAHAGASASAPIEIRTAFAADDARAYGQQTRRIDAPITDFSAQAKTAPFHR